ncbi:MULTISPECIES: YitT family protein [Marivita]|uniref:YitT family protein n=1 Tax=Marivita cryptomonadis TaxID=505252 RepID=A0A9Q2NXX8_9RHOB|nr:MULTISPECIES: YitT family protein [Marivita]MCR9169623.1 YitT family protein [Paracoccaceae bacterium]MBM2320768.1 YitT family protein [Marivita cryptomonadis]MBM2330348.1 YitT family protein [Marivita cryptomonadis]MBM2339935.1 YitT family protein [Marivita cryptomonadis]MBM2344595.1 YitT family protein [Marivita cryptomonadis]
MFLLSKPPADRHTVLEDIQGILIGATLVALAIQFLSQSNLLTGQIAGLALVTRYVTDWSFGLVFFVLNLPFYILAVHQLGWTFTLKTFAAVALMSTISELFPHVLTLDMVHPALGAVLGGVLAGIGLLSLFRHGATLGGVGIVALWLQDTRGIQAGNTQLMFDVFVFGLAFWVLPAPVVVWSLLGAVILNMIVTVNHRRDRYVARS